MAGEFETINTTNTRFVGPDALPASDPDSTNAAYQQILARHLLVTLRHESGLTMEEVADRKDVTKAAVQQLETREFSRVRVGSLIAHIQALGFDVDEQWLAQTLVAALPALAEL